MKKLLLILLCLPLLFSCGDKEKDNKINELEENIDKIQTLNNELNIEIVELKKLIEAEKNKGNFKEIKWTHYNSDGTIFRKEVFQYDKDGNKIEETYYNADGVLTCESKLKYDEYGNHIERVNKNTKEDAYGKLIAKWEVQYEYDTLKNWIVQTTYSDNDRSTRVEEREIEYYE